MALSWVMAMKSVNVNFLASARSWKGSNGGCCINANTGLNKFVRMGV